MTDEASPLLPDLSRCDRCDKSTLPAKLICPFCGSRDIVNAPMPEDGEVFSYTTIPHPGGGEHRIALVNAGGVRLLVPVPADAGDLGVGCRVRLRARTEPPGYEAARCDSPAPVGTNADPR